MNNKVYAVVRQYGRAMRRGFKFDAPITVVAAVRGMLLARMECVDGVKQVSDGEGHYWLTVIESELQVSLDTSVKAFMFVQEPCEKQPVQQRLWNYEVGGKI